MGLQRVGHDWVTKHSTVLVNVSSLNGCEKERGEGMFAG